MRDAHHGRRDPNSIKKWPIKNRLSYFVLNLKCVSTTPWSAVGMNMVSAAEFLLWYKDCWGSWPALLNQVTMRGLRDVLAASGVCEEDGD